ncbi:aminodeoxychorismate/anthranilate synthase component II [Motilimonas pumila]|uniref:anthranilate synthase n=1 Tax=Motilimonas pumila TaxID=2303987 RepID=A0A418YJP4_9GAMM|nr:aminodeoxychorismate/anthranilate synthase component II [Motilimonas pumila]RJG51183.1 aminodeoxychorismate/anthranilate synthase component II [Motilimonas pumila]
MAKTLFFLDNFDSFTYNLVDQFRDLGYPVRIFRNSLAATTIKQFIDQAQDPVLILSPGPGCPSEAGCMPELIKLCAGNVPMLGICLGHQALIEHYGGVVGPADEIMHGKSSSINHCQDRMFAELSHPLPVARYHSLVGTSVPAALEVVADYNGMPMAIYQADDNVIGFQFHPESILTSEGAQLLETSLNHISPNLTA